MKKFLLLASSLLFLNSCGNDPSVPAPEIVEDLAAELSNTSEETLKSPYAQTAALLDKGGVSYQLTDGAYEIEAIKPMVDFFFSMMMMGMQEGSPTPIDPKILSKLKELPAKAGVDEILVRGSSTVARENGGYLTKYALQHSAEADGWMWEVLGDEIDIAHRIRQLPDSTIILSHYSMNMPLIYAQTKLELQEFPQALDPLLEAEMQMKEMGVPLETMFHSLKQGITFAITVNDNASWSLPIPDMNLSIPETGFVIILPDAGNEILDFTLTMMKEHLPIDFYENEVEGLMVRSLPIPAPVYPPLSLQLVNLDGNTLIATSPDLMKQLILRKDGTSDIPLNATLAGLTKTTASMAMVVNPKIGSYLKTPMEKMMAAMENEDAEEVMGPMIDFYTDMFASIPNVTLNRMEGDVNISELLHQRPLSPYYSNNSALTLPAVGGLMAAIALPAFQKARSAAREASCTNNLRILEAAKDQFAIENNLASGAIAPEEGIVEFLRGGIPICPQGGTYTLHPIDKAPECSIHGSND